MMDMGGHHFEFMGFMMMIVPLLMLAFYGLVIYFLITAIRFMKRKLRMDEEILQALREWKKDV